MDGVDVSFQTLLDWASFSLRIPEAEAESLPQVGSAPHTRALHTCASKSSPGQSAFLFEGPRVAVPARSSPLLKRLLCYESGEAELRRCKQKKEERSSSCRA